MIDLMLFAGRIVLVILLFLFLLAVTRTGIGLVRGSELLVDRTATSMDQYARYGGIIPEIASRAHLESLVPVLDAALERAGVGLEDVDAVAVSAGPGLIGGAGELAVAGLAAAAGLDLGLDDHQLASRVKEGLRGAARLLGGRGHGAVEHGDAVLAEQVPGLVLVEIHAADPLGACGWLVGRGPTPGGRQW